MQIKQVDKTGGLLVISGPSGSGKTTICQRLLQLDAVNASVSATTRPKRPGEVHGKDYYFLSHEEFKKRIEDGDFIEFNEVFGNNILYGSLKGELEKGLEDKSSYYLMEIDVRGALNLQEMGYKGTYIYISPPSMDELRKRLSNRGTEDKESIEKRLKKAEWEQEQTKYYNLIVINDNLDIAVSEVIHYLRLEQ